MARDSDSGLRVTVLYFAALKELMGTAIQVLELPPTVVRVADFFRWLELNEARLRGRLDQVRCAVDGELVEGERVLSEGAEIALLPPFAGG